jgi:hypothetical protein
MSYFIPLSPSTTLQPVLTRYSCPLFPTARSSYSLCQKLTAPFQSLFAFFECYISSAIALSQRAPRPNYVGLLESTGMSAVLSVLGYRALRQVPFVQSWCEGNNWASLNDNVEKRHCALVCDIIVAGAIAV